METILPYPLAVLGKRYRDIPEDRYSDRVDALVRLGETVVKLMAAIAAKSLLLDGAPDDAFRSDLAGFKRPSLGNWANLLRAAIRPYDKLQTGPLIAAVKEWYGADSDGGDALKKALDELASVVPITIPRGRPNSARLIDVLVEYRNKSSGHGSRLSEDEYRRLHAAIRVVVWSLVSPLRFLGDFPLCYVEEVKLRGGTYHQTVKVGKGREFELQMMSTPEPLHDLRLYCFQLGDAGEPVFALDLSPYVIYRHCAACNGNQIFLFSASRGGTLEYLSPQCGHFLSIADPSGEFANIEEFLSGRLSLHALFSGKVIGREMRPTGPGASRESRNRASSLAELGDEMLKHGLVADAIRNFTEASALDPDSGIVQFGLGVALMMDGCDAEVALRHFRDATTLNPDLGPAHYAVGRVAWACGDLVLARKGLDDAISADPSNQSYRNALARLPASGDGETRFDRPVPDAQEFAAELLAEGDETLPVMRPWISAFPPWSWIASRPLAGAAVVTAALLAVALGTNLHHLDLMRASWFATIGVVCYLGLAVPLMVPSLLAGLHRDLRATVTLPHSSFRRWYLAEAARFIGSFHLVALPRKYGSREMFRRDPFLAWAFVAWFLLFLPFQVACALGMDPPGWDVASAGRYLLYGAEVFVLSWIPPFVYRSLTFIPGFVCLPVRYFVGAPEAVSLKPLGRFYLTISALASLTFLFVTLQHYLYRTFETVPVASVAFLVLCYCLVVAFMFVSQLRIMLAMGRLRERRLVEHSFHVEAAFDVYAREPTRSHFDRMLELEEQARYLRRNLGISGLSKASWVGFLCLSLVQVGLIVAYSLLVSRGWWLVGPS